VAICGHSNILPLQNYARVVAFTPGLRATVIRGVREFCCYSIIIAILSFLLFKIMVCLSLKISQLDYKIFINSRLAGSVRSCLKSAARCDTFCCAVR
jgi:hypothetical protein